MNEPRPSMISARPLDSASRVEKRWNTRIGSSELSTVTAEPSRMRFVRAAMAASAISGAEIGEIGAMMFAQADEIDAELVGERGFLDDVAQCLRLRQRPPVGAVHHVAKSVEAEFERAMAISRAFRLYG